MFFHVINAKELRIGFVVVVKGGRGEATFSESCMCSRVLDAWSSLNI